MKSKQSKSAQIRALPASMSTAEVIATLKKKGVVVTYGHVYAARGGSKKVAKRVPTAGGKKSRAERKTSYTTGNDVVVKKIRAERAPYTSAKHLLQPKEQILIESATNPRDNGVYEVLDALKDPPVIRRAADYSTLLLAAAAEIGFGAAIDMLVTTREHNLESLR